MHSSRTIVIAGTAILVFLLSGCGGGGDSGSAGSSSSSSSGSGGAAPTAANCIDPSYFAHGDSYKRDYVLYRAGGVKDGTGRATTVVSRNVSFAGALVDEHAMTDVYASTGYAIYMAISKSYIAFDGLDRLGYGVTTTFSDATPYSETLKYSPSPLRSKMLSLSVGQKETLTYSVSTLSSKTGKETVEAFQDEITFLGEESVVVPAGELPACKWEYVSNGNRMVVWYHRGSGIVLKVTGDSFAQEVSSVSVNGKPL